MFGSLAEVLGMGFGLAGVNLCGSEDRNQHSDLILRRSHALACDRLEGWPQAPSPFPSFETRRACGRDAPQRLSCETWFAFAGSPRRELARDHHCSGVVARSLRCLRLAGGVEVIANLLGELPRAVVREERS